MTKNNNSKNVHLWFGEDTFTIAEELKKEKELFGKRFGSVNIYEIDFEDQNMREEEKLFQLQDGLTTNSLFSSVKLLIVKNAFFFLKEADVDSKSGEDRERENIVKNGKEEMILKYFNNLQKSRNIRAFFVEREIDKRNRIYKRILALEKNNLLEIKEFLTPAGLKFNDWIKKRIEKSGGKISKEAIDILAIFLGRGLAQRDKSRKFRQFRQSYDLWEASNEIEKLMNYCYGREITEKDVELLVKSKVDMNIFNLIDSISSKNRKESILLLNKQIEEGLNEIYILTMFTYQFRNLLRVKDLLNNGVSNYEISLKTGMHPFVVGKSIEQCRKFKMEDLRRVYKKIFDADVAIKTGKIDPQLALDLLVVSV
jgi:DNA polymerase III delta subunit